jgi:hypothetical protein
MLIDYDAAVDRKARGLRQVDARAHPDAEDD